MNADKSETDGLESRVETREGAHIFPTAPDVCYREFRGGLAGSNWGEGLLDWLHYGDPTIKSVVLPDDLDRYRHAELFAFGTGKFADTIQVNGTTFDFPSLDVLARGTAQYDCVGKSVHRSHHLAQVPIEELRPGLNEVVFEETHAFVQLFTVRLFRESPSDFDVRFGVEQTGEGYELKVDGPGVEDVEEVDFFVRHPGMDLDASGQDDTWQVTINRELEGEWGYELSNHCGIRTEEPWRIEWQPELVPSGSLDFRSRLRLEDGTVVESPGGIVTTEHTPSSSVRFVPPNGFSPFGFHESGFNQDVNLTCTYDVPESFEARRAVLRVPVYGEIEMRLNDTEPLLAEAPTGGYYVTSIEVDLDSLRDGRNELQLRSTGGTGCYQPPGPFLYLEQ